jgi:hypothetical protein
MWAAANSGTNRTPHPQDSDWDSESSAERSTTESIDKPKSSDVVELKKRRRRKKQKLETPEATVARLTASYSAAMGEVGALHRASRQIWKENNLVCSKDAGVGRHEDPDVTAKVDASEENEPSPMQIDDDNSEEKDSNKDSTTDRLEEAYTTIQTVAQSARSSLEQSLLLDPVVMAPILLPTDTTSPGTKNSRVANKITEEVHVENMTSAWWTAWHSTDPNNKSHRHSSVARWKKLSAAHKSTVKQIAYLTLVNYADLLLCGCTCTSSDSGDILDRRPIQSLEALKLFPDGADDLAQEHCKSCLWTESKEQTLRLALASYCDASELDPSDPTLWFKVACMARALGRVVESNKSASSTSRPTSYRSLERLALERGLHSLPKGVPPNRMLTRAWREMERWDQSHESSQISEELDSVMTEESKNEPVKLVIHLPKYSWSTLGRILIRACKEGAGYGRTEPVSHVWSTVRKYISRSHFKYDIC